MQTELDILNEMNFLETVNWISDQDVVSSSWLVAMLIFCQKFILCNVFTLDCIRSAHFFASRPLSSSRIVGSSSSCDHDTTLIVKRIGAFRSRCRYRGSVVSVILVTLDNDIIIVLGGDPGSSLPITISLLSVVSVLSRLTPISTWCLF